MNDKARKMYTRSLKTTVITTSLSGGIYGVLLSEIIASFSLIGFQQGLVSSIVSIGALVSLFGNNFLRTKISKAYLILAGGVLSSAILFFQGVHMPFVLFLVACFFLGIGFGTVDSCQSALLADLHPQNTAKQMGSMHGVFGIGALLSPLVLRSLLSYISWREIFMLVGGFSLALFIQFIYTTNKEKNVIEEIQSKEPKLSLLEMTKLLQNKYFILLLATTFFGVMAQNGFVVWVIRYVDVYLEAPTIATFCLSIFWIASTISRFGAPMLKMKPAKIIEIGAFVAAIVWAIALAASVPIGICIGVAIVGILIGTCIPMALSIGAAEFPTHTGLSTCAIMMVMTLARICSPILISLTLSRSNMQIAMFVIVIFLIINGIFAFVMVKEEKYRQVY